MRGLKRLVWRLLLAFLWALAGIRYLACWLQKLGSSRRHVLYCASNELMLSYVSRVWEGYFGSGDYPVHLSGPTLPPGRDSVRVFLRGWKMARKMGVPYWPGAIARNFSWGLVLCAKPDDLPSGFDREVPKIMTGHSLVGFKRYDGHLYPYLPQYLLTPEGAYMFDSFLEASRYKLSRVVEGQPQYEKVIDLVGGLPADILLEKNKGRDEIRKDLGFSSGDFVVLLQSTFGRSLMEDFGESLLVECERLAAKFGYRFIVSLHPSHWHGLTERMRSFGKLALRHESETVRVRRETEDQDLSMIASDMVITDHTSLGVNYALLGKPMLFYFPESGNQAGEMLSPLACLYPAMKRVEDIESMILEAREVHDPRKLQEVIDQFVEPGGNARRNIDEVLTRLLTREV